MTFSPAPLPDHVLGRFDYLKRLFGTKSPGQEGGFLGGHVRTQVG